MRIRESLSKLVTRKRIAILIGVLLSPFLFTLIYAFIALHWSYSEGERAGVLQKVSQRGWFCKTYEGELAQTTVPGSSPVIWYFSVRDESIIPKMNDALGKQVVLHYAEHRGVPSTCFGDTEYFVTDVRVQGGSASP